MDPQDTPRRRSPALIATLVAVPAAVIAVFIVVAALAPGSDPGPLPLREESSAPSADCTRFLAALPRSFPGFGDRSVTEDGLVQWSASEQGDATGPVQLRCGVPRPTGLAPTSALQVVDPVQWFAQTEDDARGTLWVAVDHRPYVALWLPVNSGNGPIAQTSTVIDATLARASLDLGS